MRVSAPRQRDRVIDQLFFAQQQRFANDKAAPLYQRQLGSVSLTRVKESLGNEEVVLEYVLTEVGEAYCVFISRQDVRIERLGSAAKLTSLVQTFATDLKTNKPWKAESRELYASLIGSLPDLSGFSRITIIPDGALHTIPFEVLLSPSGDLLGNTKVTAYSPSAVSHLLLKKRTGLSTSNAFLGVGGAIYNKAGTQPFRLAKSAMRGTYLGFDPEKLSNLPSSREEVQTAAALLRTAGEQETLQVGSNATESAFVHAPLSEFNIIHLAIHAIANTEDPSRAALIFPPDSQNGDDGLLSPQDIAKFRLGAHVVVLSACDTAVGHLEGQVGVANLARAFLHAGADSVVSTLWPVDDAHSLALMKAFYKHLATGDAVATALASAKRELLGSLGENASPLDWAGFVLLGNGDAFVKSSQVARLEEGPHQ